MNNFRGLHFCDSLNENFDILFGPIVSPRNLVLCSLVPEFLKKQIFFFFGGGG